MKNVIKVMLACFVLFSTAGVYATTITGSFGVGGAYTATGGDLTKLDMSDVTAIDFTAGVEATSSSGVFATTIIDDTITGNGGKLDIFSALPVDINIISDIGGWTFNLETFSIVQQDAGKLELLGTGTVFGNGYTPTQANWSFSAVSRTNYSMTVTAVPVPAAVWLFGSGLIGLVGVVRRKT